MTASNAHRALGATITRLADHQRTAQSQALMPNQPITRQSLPARRADWADRRHAAALIVSTRRANRVIAACMAIIFAALIGAVQLESAVTAMIAADLAE